MPSSAVQVTALANRTRLDLNVIYTLRELQRHVHHEAARQCLAESNLTGHVNKKCPGRPYSIGDTSLATTTSVWMQRPEHNLAGDTVDPNPLHHDSVLRLDRHAAGQKQLSPLEGRQTVARTDFQQLMISSRSALYVDNRLILKSMCCFRPWCAMPPHTIPCLKASLVRSLDCCSYLEMSRSNDSISRAMSASSCSPNRLFNSDCNIALYVIQTPGSYSQSNLRHTSAPTPSREFRTISRAWSLSIIISM